MARAAAREAVVAADQATGCARSAAPIILLGRRRASSAGSQREQSRVMVVVADKAVARARVEKERARAEGRVVWFGLGCCLWLVCKSEFILYAYAIRECC